MKTTPANIAIFLSKGRSFVDVLRDVRHAYPGAHIDAIIPPAYPLSEEEQALANQVIETEQAHYSPRDTRALRRLIRQLRASHYDLFVILFDSPKLRLIARLSNAKTCVFHRLDHRLLTIRPTIPGIVADVVFRNVWGRVVYGALWLITHFLPARQTR